MVALLYLLKIMNTRLLLLILFSTGLFFSCSHQPEPGSSTNLSTLVTTTTVAFKDLAVQTSVAGRTNAFRTSEVRPQVGGIVEARLFQEGSHVNQGDVLYRINADSYRAEVEYAIAERDMAQAELVNLKANVDRYGALVKNKRVAPHEFDLALANYQQGEARLAASHAALKSARIKLSRTEVTAPIGGIIGRSQVSEGALVSPMQNQPLAIIQQFDPIYVDMVQSSQQFLALKRRLQSGSLQRGSGEVSLELADGQSYLITGHIQFTEMQVDPTSGAITLRAQFANPDLLLLPGMYVRAHVNQGVETQVALLPQQSVSYNEAGNASVWVVNSENQAERRKVDVVARQDDQWVVNRGLEPGEQVIVGGLQRVYDGVPVVTQPYEAQLALSSEQPK